MKTRKRKGDSAQAHCVRNGIKIYPVKVNGNWYIEVDNNGKLKRYPKIIKKKGMLRIKHLMNPVTLTYEHWSKKIEDQLNETDKGNNNT